MFFGGIDVAKNRHEIYIIDDAGDVVLQLYIDNRTIGMDKLVVNLSRLKIEPSNVQFCMKATGHYWLSLLLSFN
jgi:transposase